MINSGTIRTINKTGAHIVLMLAAIYLVVVMYTNLPVYLDRLSGETNAPQWYLLQLVIGAILGLLMFSRARKFIYSSYALWIGALLLVYIVTYLRLVYLDSTADSDDIGHAMDRIERALLIPVFGLICFLCKPKLIEVLFCLIFVLVPVPVILGFFNPDLFPSSVNVRSAGMYFNANQACEAVLLWFLIAHRRLPRFLVIPMYALSGLAIILTFSRSGMLGWAIVGGYLIYSRRVTRLALAVPIFAALFYTTLLTHAEDILSQFVDSESRIEHMINRLDVFGRIGGRNDETFDDASSLAREEIAADTLQAVLVRPILGYGYDVERNLDLNAHNMFLQLWYTFGLAGLILFAWLAYLLYVAGLQQGYGRLSPYLLIFLWFSFFDHAHTTDNYWLIAYAFVLRDLRWRRKGFVTPAKTNSESRTPRRRSKSGRKSKRRLSSARSTSGYVSRATSSAQPNPPVQPEQVRDIDYIDQIPADVAAKSYSPGRRRRKKRRFKHRK